MNIKRLIQEREREDHKSERELKAHLNCQSILKGNPLFYTQVSSITPAVFGLREYIAVCPS
jgi:hypothetical protein